MKSRRNLFFLLSHQPNPRFVKQINFFSDDYNVTVGYFNRPTLPDLKSSLDSRVTYEKLGEIRDSRYLERVAEYLKSFFRLRKVLAEHRPDLVLVNNIDVLVFFLLAFHIRSAKTMKIMEISDLREYTYGKGRLAAVLRFIERLLFRHFVDRLIVTSPKFYELHYRKIYQGPHFLLENKPLSRSLPPRLPPARTPAKTVVGIVGLLLQGGPYKTLLDLLKDRPGFEVHVHGIGRFKSLIESYANQHSNIKYFGPYNFFNDSARIYASLDVLFMAYDTTNNSLNNLVALPNKFYEAMYFQVPVVTSAGTLLGEYVDRYRMGRCVGCEDGPNLLAAIEDLTNKQEEVAQHFLAIPKSAFTGDDDYRALAEFLKSTPSTPEN